MTVNRFSTLALSTGQSSREWQDTVSRTLFDLDISSRQPHFSATLENRPFGRLSITRLKADPAEYNRTSEHLRHATQEHFLITLNNLNPVSFHQLGRDTLCRSGNFLLELSHEPYRFAAKQPMEVYVLKVPKSVMKEYLRHPERYCALDFDGQSGLGLVFRRYLLHISQNLDTLGEEEAALVEKQLLELFAHTANKDERVLQAADSAIRAAHLLHIEQFALNHLERNDLSPEQTAAACGISVRYLHHIFKDTGTTFSDWLRTQRLESARRQLQQPRFSGSLAQLAYSLGFTDQSHFSKVYRQQFGESPRDTLSRSKQQPAG